MDKNLFSLADLTIHRYRSSIVLYPSASRARHHLASTNAQRLRRFRSSTEHCHVIGIPYLRENTTIHTFVAMLEYVSLGLIGHLGFGLAVRA